MSPDNNNVDDLDFSDLDLDESSDAGFEEEFDDGGASESEAAPARKKSSMMFYVIAGVVVIGVVILGLFQFGILGGAQMQPYMADNVAPAEMPEQGAQPGTSDPFNVMGTPEAMPPAGTTATDPAMVEAMVPTGAAPAFDANGQPLPAAVPAEDMPVTSVMPAGEAQPQSAMEGATLPMPAQPGDTVPQAAPVETASPATEDGALQPAPTVMDSAVAPAMAEAAAEAVVAPSATAPVTVTATDLMAIMERLEALEKRLDAQAAAPEASPAVANELQDLKAAVARLENREPAPAAEEPAPKPVAKKKTAKKAPAKKKPATNEWDKPYDGGAVGAAPASGGSSASYSLRAAQPGVAWVSGPDGVLQEVRVGDNLPGIGHVSAISNVNGQWSVIGPNGRLSQ